MKSRWLGAPTSLGGGRWIHVHQVQYLSTVQAAAIAAASDDDTKAKLEAAAKERPLTWEIASRPTAKCGAGCDAAELAVTVREAGGRAYFAFVKQYRAPLDRLCVEFPAGLIDAGEDAVTAGLRELREETGIADGRLGATVSVVRASPPIAYEPGLCSSCCALVEVDVALPAGLTARQYRDAVFKHNELEEAEVGLELLVLPVDSLMAELDTLKDTARIDSKVWSFCVGARMSAATMEKK